MLGTNIAASLPFSSPPLPFPSLPFSSPFLLSPRLPSPSALLQLLRPIYRRMAENQNAEIFAANTLLVVLGTSVLTARVSNRRGVFVCWPSGPSWSTVLCSVMNSIYCHVLCCTLLYCTEVYCTILY